MRTFAALSLALLLAAPASAQQTVEGLYTVVGTDAVGNYTGRVQVMDQGGWFHVVREVTDGWLRRQSPDVSDALASDVRSPEREKARRRLYGYLTRRGFRGEALSEGMELARRRR